MRVDGLEVDLARRTVRVQGQEVHLTPTEFDLLRLLVRNRGRLMTHRDLLVSVWGPGYGEDTQVLRAHIADLRRKTSRPRAGATSVPTQGWATASRAEPSVASQRDLRAHDHGPVRRQPEVIDRARRVPRHRDEQLLANRP